VEDFRSGNLNYLTKMPILNMTPLLGLYHLTDAAEETHFTKENLEYDFSPLTIKMVKS
jgi:hypothetical protein